MDSLAKFRLVWREIESARKGGRYSHRYRTDPALIYVLLGFALHNLEKAQKELEEAARAIKAGQQLR